MAITQIILIISILFHSIHFTTSQSQSIGFSLKLIPMFSPQSPLYPGNLTHSQRIQKMVEISIARAKNLGSQNTILGPENINLPVHTQDSFYAVEVSLGTPPRTQLLLLDTAGGLTWTQCDPSTNPFHQFTPLFDPRSSHSYMTLPCNHPLCSQPPYQCINDKCIYGRSYGGGVVTRGVVSVETFTFQNNNGGVQVIPDVVFGCSHDSRGLNFNNIVSGAFGMNLAPDSIITQLKNTIYARFSYCLIHSDPQLSQQTYLKFGMDAVMGSLPFSQISIVPQHISPNYYLPLLDISVGNRRLGLQPEMFALSKGGSGGFIIDTGSPFSTIERKVYGLVMRAFNEHFTTGGLRRLFHATERFEYCYAQKAGYIGYTTMTFHFQTADFVVRPAYMYYHDPQGKYFCVALLPNDNGKTILGAWQQQNTKFLFDVHLEVVQFVPSTCNYSDL